jgi:hypothetical protein
MHLITFVPKTSSFILIWPKIFTWGHVSVNEYFFHPFFLGVSVNSKKMTITFTFFWHGGCLPKRKLKLMFKSYLSRVLVPILTGC